MLLAYGIALRLGTGLGGDIPAGELALTTVLKMIVQPLVAWAVAAGLLGVRGHALLAVVVCRPRRPRRTSSSTRPATTGRRPWLATRSC